MANASLTYEILIYLDSFFFGLLACCEIGMAVLKAIYLKYPEDNLKTHCIVLVVILTVEAIRVLLGRRGSLADRDWQVVVSAVLTVPCMLGMVYLLFLQHEVLKLERILCALMLCLHATELVYAVKFAFSTCRPVTYT